MKKYLNYALFYAVLAMIAGVFYREFTKFNNFYADTALAKVHTHLFVLGMIIFLLISLFFKKEKIVAIKMFKSFMYIYNFGLLLMSTIMSIRGILQVLTISLSTNCNAVITGLAGISHLCVGIGLLLLFLVFKKQANQV